MHAPTVFSGFDVRFVMTRSSLRSVGRSSATAPALLYLLHPYILWGQSKNTPDAVER